jgi:hypothetical protein
MTAAGGLGGLIVGLGFVFLFAAPTLSTPDKEGVPAANIDARNDEDSSAGIQKAAMYPTLQKSDLQPANSPYEEFGMFKGMSLEQAIRSIEGSVSQGSV